MAITLTSLAFKQDGHIPSKYTCEGEDVSPPLAWDGVPEGTKSLVLIIDDPDAPDPKAPQRVWVHWVVYNIPPGVNGLPENASKAGLPQGTAVGLNDFKKTGYGGPCPPIGRHRYFHKLYALDTTLDLRRATKDEIELAMTGHGWPMQSSSVRIKRVTGRIAPIISPTPGRAPTVPRGAPPPPPPVFYRRWKGRLHKADTVSSGATPKTS